MSKVTSNEIISIQCWCFILIVYFIHKPYYIDYNKPFKYCLALISDVILIKENDAYKNFSRV